MSTPSTERPFIPAGVNPGVWLGFEGRVRQRRFQMLVGTVDAAIARGDLDAAAIALEEAEGLQPHAPQLADLQWRLARLRDPQPARRAWIRPLSAILLPIIGMSLLTFADSLRHRDTRSATLGPPTTPAGVPATVPAATVIVESPPSEPALPPQLPQRLGPAPTIGNSPPRAIATALFESRRTAEPETASTFPGVERPVQPLRRAPVPAATPEITAASPRPAPALPDEVEVVAANPAEPLAAPPAATPAVAVVPEVPDRRHVAATLDAYAHAFAQLDARAARAVWPSVDERALARAFAGLVSQDIAFDDCAITVRGTRADAACSGTASYVTRVGKDERRVEPRTWQFHLEREGDGWKIATAEAQRR